MSNVLNYPPQKKKQTNKQIKTKHTHKKKNNNNNKTKQKRQEAFSIKDNGNKVYNWTSLTKQRINKNKIKRKSPEATISTGSFSLCCSPC